MVLILAIAGMTAACTDTSTGPGLNDAEAAAAVRTALYAALATTYAGEDEATYCVSEGDGSWTARQDPDPMVLESLAVASGRFVAASTCTVTLTGVTVDGGPALLLHIEQVQRNGSHAQATVLYRRTSLDAAAYTCAATWQRSTWTAEVCTPHPGSDELGLRVAAYLRLRELSTTSPNSSAFCLSEGEGSARRDPEAAVLFRLQGAPRAIVGASTCTWSGTDFHVPGGQSARALHLERIERNGGQATVLVSFQGGLWLPEAYDCTLRKDGQLWTAETCVPNPDPGVSPDDDADIRAALYRHLITLEGWAGTAAACLSEGSLAEMEDAPAAVLSRLTDSAGSFVPASTCTVRFEGTFSADGHPAQLLHIESLERHRGYAKAVVAFQRSGLEAGGHLCELVKQGEDWIISHCRWNSRHTVDSRYVAVYHALRTASPFGTPAAYCASTTVEPIPTGGVNPTPMVVPNDPREGVMFRLAGSEQPFIAASSCIPSGDEIHTPAGTEAHTLHIASQGTSSAVAAYRRKQDSAVFDCTLVNEGAIWTAACTRRVEAALTDDDIDLRVAAYKRLAEWAEPTYQWHKDAFCVGEMVGFANYLRDPVSSALVRLSAADPRFIGASACRYQQRMYLTGLADRAVVLLVSVVNWQDGYALVDMAFAMGQGDVRMFSECRWEKADGEWTLIVMSGTCRMSIT